jgi:hypothetical protein
MGRHPKTFTEAAVPYVLRATWGRSEWMHVILLFWLTNRVIAVAGSSFLWPFEVIRMLAVQTL